jgi:hypothetical protein
VQVLKEQVPALQVWPEVVLGSVRQLVQELPQALESTLVVSQIPLQEV